MNNLHIQVTPLQVNCRSKSPLQLTCLFKKVAISTGHILEKRQLRAQQSSSGSNYFDNGPTFNLSKQFQLNNTKISMHFMRKKDRAFTCIGSAEIDVATLPSTPCSVLEYPLHNSIYPQSSMKLEVRRQQQKRAPSKPSKYRGEEMNLLRTEGQIKEQLLIGRRKNPNTPTAYEISRKNFKQLQTSCHQSNKSSISKKQKSKSSKGYRQLYQATNKSSKPKNQKIQNKTNKEEDDSTPRRRTPEPISTSYIGRNERTKKPEPPKKYAIGKQRGRFSIQNSRQTSEQPSQLSIQPYNDSKIQSFDSSFQRPSNDRYGCITNKLQLIQQQILKFEDNQKCKTEMNSKKISDIMDQNIKPNIHKSQQDLTYNNQEVTMTTIEQINPVNSCSNNFISRIISSSQDQFEENVITKSKQTDKQIIQLKNLQTQNQQLMKQNQIISSKFADAESTVHKLMKQLSELVKDNRQKSEQLQILKKRVQKSEHDSQQQHRLLQKMTHLYEEKIQQVFALQEKQIQSETTEYIGIIKKTDSFKENDKSSKLKQVLQLEQKCSLLEDELRSKKNILAEIVNIIWRFGDSALMQSIEKYMQQ